MIAEVAAAATFLVEIQSRVLKFRVCSCLFFSCMFSSCCCLFFRGDRMVVDLRTKKLHWSLLFMVLCYISLFLRFWNVFFFVFQGRRKKQRSLRIWHGGIIRVPRRKNVWSSVANERGERRRRARKEKKRRFRGMYLCTWVMHLCLLQDWLISRTSVDSWTQWKPSFSRFSVSEVLGRQCSRVSLNVVPMVTGLDDGARSVWLYKDLETVFFCSKNGVLMASRTSDLLMESSK